MSQDKVTVDEPLISTDVDSLIRTLADRKKIALNELRKTVKIDKKTLDKWISVLEDEGYITVEYGLGGTNILWREIEEIPAEEKTYRTQAEETTQIQPKEVTEPGTESGEAVFTEIAPEPRTASAQEESGSEDFEAVVPIEEEPEPEELLSEYLARKKVGSSDNESIKSKILTNLEDEQDSKVEAIKEEEEPAEPPEMSDEVEEETAEKPVFKITKPAQTIRPIQKGVGAADVRELMSSYLTEINKEKAKIESLRKEREALYRDKFATMEGKMQADIVVLAEKILEKQSKVAELKEGVLELPDKLDELSKLQEQMEALKKEGREALLRTREKADKFIASVGESKAQVHSRISEVDAEIEKQAGKIKDLEKVSASLDARSQKLKGGLQDAKSQIEELNSAMTTLMGDLQDVDTMKGGIEGMTNSIKQNVSARGEELESLEKELEGISSVEHWVQEYIRDYEQKIDDIEQYVSHSEDELADLKESAESLYLKKYLGELENMTDAYENELHDAVSREKDIEAKISESRSRISELVEESQGMIKKLKSDSPDSSAPDYSTMVAKVKEKTAKLKTVINEKQAERSKLVDDSKRTRKTVKLVKAPTKKAKHKKRK